MRNRTLNVNTTAVGNVGTGEDDLMSYALPANLMSVNEDGFEFRVWGITNNNGNAKTIRVYFGATLIASESLPASVADSWHAWGAVIRTGATAQIAVCTIDVGDKTTNPVTGTASPAETLANSITFKITGEATADNDVVQLGMIVQPVRYA